MKIVLALLVSFLAVSSAFDVSSHYVVAQIALQDLQATYGAKVHSEVMAMLAPIDSITGVGNFKFQDAFVYPLMEANNGYDLAHEWHYQELPFFDGIPEFSTEMFDKYNLLNSITYSLFTVDAARNSRISKEFPKAYELR